jgi:hypothetical protein
VRSTHSWENNIKIDLVEIRRYYVERILMAQDKVRYPAVVNTVMNLHVTLKVENYLLEKDCAPWSFF